MNKPSLTKNTTHYTLALTVQKILAFIYFWFIANALLPSELGQYVFALSFTTMFSIFADLGLSPILTREASKNSAQANLYLKNVLALKIPLAILTLLGAVFFINITGKPPAVRILVYLASFIMLLDSFSLSFWVIFRARQIMKYESLATVVVQLIIFTLGLAALKTSGEVKYLMLALLFASLFNFFLSLALLKFKLKFSLRPKYEPDITRYFLKIVPAFALAGIFVKIYNTSDSVLLSYLDSDAAVGFFAVPAKVVYALQQIIPAAFAAVIFPAFSFYYANSKELLLKTFNQACRYLIIISLPLGFGIISLAPQIVNSFWPEYQTTISTFIIMSLAIPFIFLAFPTGYLLNSCDRQKNTTLNRGLVTALAVILNVILIPRLSFLGAGITFFITNFILLFLDFYWVRKIIKLNYIFLLKTSMQAILASLIMALIVILALNFLPAFWDVKIQLLLLAGLGGLIYFVVLYLLRGFSLNEAITLTRKGIID